MDSSNQIMTRRAFDFDTTANAPCSWKSPEISSWMERTIMPASDAETGSGDALLHRFPFTVPVSVLNRTLVGPSSRRLALVVGALARCSDDDYG
jgi:hypothetical protein